MVTAELATVLPVLVLLTFVGVAAVTVVRERIRCADGAREAARAVARGDTANAGTFAIAGAGAPVATSVRSSGAGLTTVTVTMDVRPLGWLPGVRITETATVATEP